MKVRQNILRYLHSPVINMQKLLVDGGVDVYDMPGLIVLIFILYLRSLKCFRNGQQKPAYLYNSS